MQVLGEFRLVQTHDYLTLKQESFSAIPRNCSFALFDRNSNAESYLFKANAMLGIIFHSYLLRGPITYPSSVK